MGINWELEFLLLCSKTGLTFLKALLSLLIKTALGNKHCFLDLSLLVEEKIIPPTSEWALADICLYVCAP